jgi:hypothetical protein
MKPNTISIKLNAWIVCAVFILTNLITIGLWQPWVNKSVSDRTITITGSTTIEAEPDQYVFSPYYQREGTDKTTVNDKISTLSKTIIAKLKSLSVKDSAIKTDVSAYDYGSYYTQTEDNNYTSTLSLTVTLKDKNLSQKVQDYLATTEPSGSVTPNISFSTAKQKALESQAREQALKDAKSKAETGAGQVDAKLGRVIRVSDISSNSVTPLPWMLDTANKSVQSSAESDAKSSYSIQPGLDEYSFSIDVVYELR